MTLADAFAAYTARAHSNTMRPFLAYRVSNAANTNSRTATLSRACAAGATLSPLSPPTTSAGDV